MPFLSDLRSLDAKATPSPWECDDGEGYSLLRIRAASRTVAEVPGDDAMTGPTGALLVLLRNHAARIAAVVEAGWATVDRYEAAGLTSPPMRDLRAALLALDGAP